MANEGMDAVFYALVFFFHADGDLAALGQFAFGMAIVNFAKFFDFGIVNSLSSIIVNFHDNHDKLRKLLFLSFSVSNSMFIIFLTLITGIVLQIYDIAFIDLILPLILSVLILNVSLIGSIFDGFKHSILKNITNIIAIIFAIPLSFVVHADILAHEIYICFLILTMLKIISLLILYNFTGLPYPLRTWNLKLAKELIGITYRVQLTSLLSSFLNPFLKIVIGPNNYLVLGAVEFALQITMRIRKFINVYSRTFIPYITNYNTYSSIKNINYYLAVILLLFQYVVSEFSGVLYTSRADELELMFLVGCAWCYNINSICPFYLNIVNLRSKINLYSYLIIFVIFSIPSVSYLLGMITADVSIIIFCYAISIISGSTYLVVRELLARNNKVSLVREGLLLCFTLVFISANI